MWLCCVEPSRWPCVDLDLHAWDSPSAEGRRPLGCPPGRRRLPQCSCVGSGPSSSVGRTPGPRRSSLKDTPHTRCSSACASVHVLGSILGVCMETCWHRSTLHSELSLSSSSTGLCKKRLLTVMKCWECRVVPGSVRPCQESADTTSRLVYSSGFKKTHNTNETQKFSKAKQRKPGKEEPEIPGEERSRHSGNEHN